MACLMCDVLWGGNTDLITTVEKLKQIFSRGSNKFFNTLKSSKNKTHIFQSQSISMSILKAFLQFSYLKMIEKNKNWV